MPAKVQSSFRKRLHYFLRPVPMLIMASALCFTGWFVFGSSGLWESYQLRQRYNRQQAQIVELEQKKERLAKQLAELKAQDPLALETAARNFGLVAPGETIYEIKIDPEPKP